MARTRSHGETEALAWLRQQPPPLGLWMHGSLASVEEAIALVETLHALGALRVTVPAGLVIEASEGLTTCGFVVTLPEDGPDREALIWFCANETGRPAWGPDVPLETFRDRVGCRTVELAWT